MSELVRIGNFSISWYSVCILVGVLIAGALFLLECKRYEIDLNFATNLIFWTVIFGIIGARLYYVAFNWSYYSSSPIEILKVWNGGLAIHGGLLGGLLFILFYTKKYKVTTLKITDMAVVGVIIAQAIGRWGNFFNQEAHGPETTRAVLEGIRIIPKFVIDGMNINGIYYMPTFYYESLWCILGFIILLIVRRTFEYLRIGQLTGMYLIWYSIARFVIEKYRTDSLMLGNFKVAQLVSILLFVIGILLIIWNLRKSKFEKRYDDYELEDIKF
ncbi:MAG: prolipoprotein diacylglyceryl transferase [Bacilli bacterium]|nr:prolipoprotein diacylglyceryl transferase [Bacilli bacterium]